MIINTINVERNPIRFLLGTIREEIGFDFLLYLRYKLRLAQLRLIPGYFAIDDKLHLFWLPLPNTKVD